MSQRARSGNRPGADVVGYTLRVDRDSGLPLKTVESGMTALGVVAIEGGDTLDGAP